MLTGIFIGIGDLPPCDDEMYSFEVVQQRFFPELTNDDWKSQGIQVAFFKNYFTNAFIEEAQTDRIVEVKIARAFFMFFFGAFFFTNGSGLVRCGWLAAVVDLNAVGKYDWGSHALALLYLSLDSCSRLKVKSFNGPWQVLEYWAYEYTNCCIPVRDRNTPLQTHVSNSDVWPRILRWNKEFLDSGRSDPFRYNQSMARDQFEMRTPSSIIWQPYNNSSSTADVYVIEVAKYISRFRHTFTYSGQGVWYLADRCIRQLTGDIAIPKNPPPQMRVMASDATLPEPIKASPFVPRVDQFTYNQYWTRVSIGPIMPTLSHATNVDFIGPASIRDTAAQLPCWQPSQYPTQSTVETSGLFGESYVEVPLFHSGTTVKNLDCSVNVPFHHSGQPTYEELYNRCQHLSNIEAQLRRLILSDMVMRESIPNDLTNTRRSVSMGRASLSRQRAMNANLADTGASTSTVVPETQYSYEQ